MPVLELVGLLPPPGTGPVLLHVGQGLCVVVPGEGLDAVLVEAAEDAAQPRLLQEALVLLHGSDVVTQPAKEKGETMPQRPSICDNRNEGLPNFAVLLMGKTWGSKIIYFVDII